MCVEYPAVDARSRRHVIRIGALLSAAAMMSVLPTKKAKAAGRHSDPEYCDPLCVLRGTRIETVRGEVCIEDLAIGDLIATEDGSYKPIRWIGRKTWRKSRGAFWPNSVDPVLVMASAIGDGVPARDLYLSPKHAVFMDGYLIPAMFLINGATIRQGAWVEDTIDYYHLECGEHEVMFADRLAVETFRLQDTYDGFANGDEITHRDIAHLAPPAPYAPVLGYWTLCDDAMALLRSLGSLCIDLRDPIHVAYDRIAARAARLDS